MLPEKVDEKIQKMEERTLEIIQDITDDVKSVFRVNRAKLNGELIANISQNQRLVENLSFYKAKVKGAFRHRHRTQHELLEKINNGEVTRPDGKKRIFTNQKEKDTWIKAHPKYIIAEARIDYFQLIVDHIKTLMECCKNKNYVVRYLNSVHRLKD